MKCKLLPLERVLLGMCLKLYENHQGYESKGLGKIRHSHFAGTFASSLKWTFPKVAKMGCEIVLCDLGS